MRSVNQSLEKYKTKPRIMSWTPQQRRSNPPSATTSPRKSLQPKTQKKNKMKLQWISWMDPRPCLARVDIAPPKLYL
jgi:hypothetical protein